jgi:lipid-A-disaccharide synthase
MRLFFSAGEPSGDLHGANLIRAINARHPSVEIVGYGGERMADAGARLDYLLCNLSVMGVRRIADHLATFLKLIRTADHSFRRRRPDAVILIDYPGLNWWIAKRAHRLGIPVVYFVPPQLWAWAGWRVGKMRRTVDHVLCTLPFEQDWYATRGVNATYIGHPYFDELQHQPLDAAFLADQRRKPGPVLALLPGSRTQEVTDNLPSFAKTAQRVHMQCPEARFLVASFNEKQRQMAAAMFAGTGMPVETHCGRTPEIISLARACLSVSGSVGLELLHRAVPSVVHYKVDRFTRGVLAPVLLKVKWISLVNLLANEELFPEFLTSADESDRVAKCLGEWLTDDRAHGSQTGRLEALRRRVAQPGACDRAADYILRVVGPPRYTGLSTGSRSKAAG